MGYVWQKKKKINHTVKIQNQTKLKLCKKKSLPTYTVIMLLNPNVNILLINIEIDLYDEHKFITEEANQICL